MEIKKSESANLESKKLTWILLGFILVLAAHFVAFEWTQYEQEFDGTLIDAGDIILEEEVIPITMPEKKTIPPPPQAVTQAEVLNIVEDDAEIEETTIVSAEDQSDFVEITDDVPIVVEEPVDEVSPEEHQVSFYLPRARYPRSRHRAIRGKLRWFYR